MTVMKQTSYVFRLKDPISSLSHFIGFALSLPAGLALLVTASARGCGLVTMAALSVFSASLSMLYFASAAYHAFYFDSWLDRLFRKIDHCSIFLLIAGSYTPICVTVLEPSVGIPLLYVIYGIAGLGILFKLCWITCPKYVSSIMYIGMGWACLSVLPQIIHGLGSGFWWLLAGGGFYTVGGVIYALKPNLFPKEESTGFGNHELFHLFVLAGSLCHYLLMLGTITLLG